MYLSSLVTPPGLALAEERYINRRDIHPASVLTRPGTGRSVAAETRAPGGEERGRGTWYFSPYGEAATPRSPAVRSLDSREADKEERFRQRRTAVSPRPRRRRAQGRRSLRAAAPPGAAEGPRKGRGGGALRGGGPVSAEGPRRARGAGLSRPAGGALCRPHRSVERPRPPRPASPPLRQGHPRCLTTAPGDRGGQLWRVCMGGHRQLAAASRPRQGVAAPVRTCPASARGSSPGRACTPPGAAPGHRQAGEACLASYCPLLSLPSPSRAGAPGRVGNAAIPLKFALLWVACPRRAEVRCPVAGGGARRLRSGRGRSEARGLRSARPRSPARRSGRPPNACTAACPEPGRAREGKEKKRPRPQPARPGRAPVSSRGGGGGAAPKRAVEV
ncbi:translation initiation factor IF-2 [Melanerpes formicivorus]|uniref:translation initiation factor IF-2 n=1 Tax=Melanerpes formicivorus TaxID=211600 RepID=UPI00358FD0B5